MAQMMADMVADMEVDMMVDMVTNMEVDTILTRFHNFDQISHFRPNFTMLQFGERVDHGGWLMGPNFFDPKA